MYSRQQLVFEMEISCVYYETTIVFLNIIQFYLIHHRILLIVRSYLTLIFPIHSNLLAAVPNRFKEHFLLWM